MRFASPFLDHTLGPRMANAASEPGTEVALEQAWSAFIQGGEQAGDFRLRRADGTSLIVEYNAKANSFAT